ncbi:MAG: glycosyl hydrolase [Anaerolineaceae bacterium]|nr:glycosyl hydrolase [Anaerolineaceae bacterium]
MKRLLGTILVVLVEIASLNLLNNNIFGSIVMPQPGSSSNLPQSAANADSSASMGADLKIPTPAAGQFYQGVYPGDITRLAQPAAVQDIRAYEQAAGKSVAWVYFSSDWGKDRSFPMTTAETVRQLGKIPFIRLMLMTDFEQGHPDPVFTLQNIIQGDFDPDLRAWARGARLFGGPLLVEYGTEVNGNWFPWNSQWNIGLQDVDENITLATGAERFKEAYRHIISIFRQEGVHNISWVFHDNAEDDPAVPWNRLEDYYPGDDWIDWIGVSVYGAQRPLDEQCKSFQQLMDGVYPRLISLSATKPLVLLEFGVTSGSPLCSQSSWAATALSDLTALRWPRLVGFSWWNETWQNDNDPDHNTDFRVQDSTALQVVFHKYIAANNKVLGAPLEIIK